MRKPDLFGALTAFSTKQGSAAARRRLRSMLIESLEDRRVMATEVTSAFIYYNNSAFEASGPSQAIDTGRPMLRAAGQPRLTSPANVSSYSRGLNGVVLDFQGLNTNALSLNDFVFRRTVALEQSSVAPVYWPTAPAPTLTLQPTGSNTKRLFVEWNNGEIQNSWLQVVVKANANTGLPIDTAFYAGNMIADVNGAVGLGSSYGVSRSDSLAVQAAVGTVAAVTDQRDVDKNGLINSADTSIVSNLARFVDGATMRNFYIPIAGSTEEGHVSGSDYFRSRYRGELTGIDSLNAYHANVSGGTYPSGIVGQAFGFDGVDDELGINASNWVNGAVTYAFWYYSTGTFSTQTILGVEQPNGKGWALQLDAPDRLSVKINTDMASQKLLVSRDLSENVWHFVVLTINDAWKEVSLKINSEPTAKAQYTGSFSAGSSVATIGKAILGGSRFVGRVDELYVAERREIDQYALSLFASPTPTVGAVSLNPVTWAGDQPLEQPGTMQAITQRVFPVDKNGQYRVTVNATTTAGTPDFAGVAALDIDKRRIDWVSTGHDTLTDTVLVKPLKPGDTSVYVENATAWYRGADQSKRSITYLVQNASIGWQDGETANYRSVQNAWAENGITGNVITLSQPYNGVYLSPGTKVRNRVDAMAFQNSLLNGYLGVLACEQIAATFNSPTTSISDLARLRPGTEYLQVVGKPDSTTSYQGLVVEALDTISVPENLPAGALVGHVDIRPEGSYVFSQDQGATGIQISSFGDLYINASPSFNAEANFQSSFTVGVRAPNGNTSFRTFKLNVKDVNEPITDVSSWTISQLYTTAQAGTKVASFRAIDQDRHDIFTYALEYSGTGWDYRTAFQINELTGDVTLTNPALLQTGPLTIIARATDAAGHQRISSAVFNIIRYLPDLPAGNDKPLWVSSEVVNEGESAILHITRIDASTEQTIYYATRSIEAATTGANGTGQGGDFVSESDGIVFPVGTFTATVEITTLYDLLNEDVERFVVDFTSAVYGNAMSGIQIVNQPLPTFTTFAKYQADEVNVNEGRILNLNYKLEMPTDGPTAFPADLNFSYTTRNWSATSSDYTHSSGAFTLNAINNRNYHLDIATNADLLVEDPESFIVSVSTPWGVTTDTRVNILDSKDLPRVVVSPISGGSGGQKLTVIELNDGEKDEENDGDQKIYFGIGLTKPLDVPVSVRYYTVKGSANSDDFSTLDGIVEFASGEVWKPISTPVSVKGDYRIEPTERFYIAAEPISPPESEPLQLGIDELTIEVLDEQLPTLTVSNVSVGLGEAVNFTLSLSSPMEYQIEAKYIIRKATQDFPELPLAGISGTIMFAPGERTKTVPITTSSLPFGGKELNDLFLDVTVPWAREIGYAQIHDPNGIKHAPDERSEIPDSVPIDVDWKRIVDGYNSDLITNAYAGYIFDNPVVADTEVFTTLIRPTTHGQLHLYADGHFQYRPNLGFLGMDSFTYERSGRDAIQTGKVLLNVVNTNTIGPDQFASGGDAQTGLITDSVLINDEVLGGKSVSFDPLYLTPPALVRAATTSDESDQICRPDNYSYYYFGEANSAYAGDEYIDPSNITSYAFCDTHHLFDGVDDDQDTARLEALLGLVRLPSGRIKFDAPYVYGNVRDLQMRYKYNLDADYAGLYGNEPQDELLTLDLASNELAPPLAGNHTASVKANSSDNSLMNVLTTAINVKVDSFGIVRDSAGRILAAHAASDWEARRILLSNAPSRSTAQPGRSVAGGWSAIESDGSVRYTPPRGFVGEDWIPYVIRPEDGRLGIVDDAYFANVSARDSFVGGWIRVTVGTPLIPAPDPSEPRGQYSKFTAWTHDVKPFDVYAGADSGFFVWNDHNSGSVDLVLDGLNVLGNDSGGALGLHAEFAVQDPLWAASQDQWQLGQIEDWGVTIGVPVGFIGDVTAYYRLVDGNNKVFWYTSVMLSVHGKEYPPNGSTAPYFVSVPEKQLFAGAEYVYLAEAIDPDHTPVTYSLVNGPSGMAIDSLTGRLTWPSPNNFSGQVQATIEAKDGDNEKTLQHLTIDVSGANQPPTFITFPESSATVGVQYIYEFQAVDPDGDPLSFQFSGPANWTMYAYPNGLGRLVFTPTMSDVRLPINVSIEARDPFGERATQTFSVQVRTDSVENPNHAPVITSTPQIRFEQAGSNLTSVGDVTTTDNEQIVWLSLDQNEMDNAHVRFSISQGPPKIDVMLLLDDTGSFTDQNKNLQKDFPAIIAQLRDAYPGTDFGFGVSRFEDYNSQRFYEYPTGRPFILNQPILETSYPRFEAILSSALGRGGRGYGGFDGPETLIEALYQLSTGIGFDGNSGNTTKDSGTAGSLGVQIAPGNSGDVPQSYDPHSDTPFVSGHTIEAAYRLVRVAEQPPLPIGVDTTIPFNSSLMATVYTHVAEEGDKLSIDNLNYGPFNYLDNLHVYSPNGIVLIPTQLSQKLTYTFPAKGTYTVVFDPESPFIPRSDKPGPYEINEAETLQLETTNFRFKATKETNGSTPDLSSAIPFGINRTIELSQPESLLRFELDESSLLLLRVMPSVAEDLTGLMVELLDSSGLVVRHGKDAIQLLSLTQSLMDSGRPVFHDPLSNPGGGSLPSGTYYLKVKLANSQPLKLILLEPESNSQSLSLNQSLELSFSTNSHLILANYAGHAGEVIAFNVQSTAGSRVDTTVYGPNGEMLAYSDETDHLVPNLRLPIDGNYLIVLDPGLVSTSTLTGANAQITLNRLGEISPVDYIRKTAVVNAAQPLTIDTFTSEEFRLKIRANERIYFDGLDANTRVRVDFYEGDRTISVLSSELNRMLPPVDYEREILVRFEPIDLIAKVETNRMWGGGFREGALPLVIATTDAGTRYNVDEDSTTHCPITTIQGLNGATAELRDLVGNSYLTGEYAACGTVDSNYDGVKGDRSVPLVNGQLRPASIQNAVTALNNMGAVLVGVGTSMTTDDGLPVTPGILLSELGRLTGSINRLDEAISIYNTPQNNYSIASGAPLYVPWLDGNSMSTAISKAMNGAISSLGFDVDVRLRDSSGVARITSDTSFSVRPGEDYPVDLAFLGDGASHAFYLEIVRHGTNVLLGRIPIGINYSYNYDAEATDQDEDTLTWSFVGDSHGATIDSATGEISWLPPDQGIFSFTVKVDDGRGGIDTQTWSVDATDVNARNQPPQVQPIAAQTAKVGHPFELAVMATDPNNDVLHYQLIGTDASHPVPDGMVINAETGIIQWTPSPIQTGLKSVTVAVDDGRGGESQRTFSISVTNTPELTNQRPYFTSRPPLVFTFGETYTYDFSAVDPDGDPLTFRLSQSPNGMVMDTETRTLTWNPLASDVGLQFDVSLLVLDGQGANSRQSFQISALPPNQPPEFRDEPQLYAQKDQLWSYQPGVWDPNGDPLTLQLISGPAGIRMINGQLQWLAPLLGTYPIIVSASDGRGGVVRQTYTLDVLTTLSMPPHIKWDPTGPAIIGDLWTTEIEAIDPENQMVYFELRDAPAGMHLAPVEDNRNKAIVSWIPASLPGNYKVQLWVADDIELRHGSSVSFALPTRIKNNAPIITSIPFDGLVGQAWKYAFSATDPDGDPLKIELESAQPGMTMDGNGLISWVPTAPRNNPNEPLVVIRVTDGNGGVARDNVFAAIKEKPVDTDQNDAAYVTSNPTGPLYVNEPWTYQIQAVDPDGDTQKLTYSIVNLKHGSQVIAHSDFVEIDASGKLIVHPTSNHDLSLDDPTYVLTVAVTDQGGRILHYELQLRFKQRFTPPTFNATPTGKVVAGQPWTSSVTATSSNGAVVYGLSPNSVGTINANGAVSFTPPISSSGSAYPLVVEITDGSKSLDDKLLTYQQATTLVVSQQPSPQHPYFTSIPPVAAVIGGAPYTYAASAAVSSGGNLNYRLVTAPTGMALQGSTLSWQPTKFGNYPVVLEVTSGTLTTSQSFTVSAINPYLLNEPPTFVSAPPPPTPRDVSFNYQVEARDANHDELTYSLLEGPSWLSIDAHTGVLSGLPRAAGNYSVTIEAREVQANSQDALFSRQEFVLTVLQNAPPLFDSLPSEPRLVLIGSGTYSYAVKVTDPNMEDRSGLQLSLIEAPDGATLDALGNLKWEPTEVLQLGRHTFKLKVTDTSGASAVQSFTVQALTGVDHAPEFVSQVRTTLPADIAYALQLRASDLDGDDIVFELMDVKDQNNVNITGARLDNGDIFNWTPSRSLIGQEITVRFKATSLRDNKSNTQSSTVTITNLVVNSAPSIESTPRHAAKINFVYTYNAFASDGDADAIRWTLENAPSGMSVDSQTGKVSWIPNQLQLGDHAITLAAADGYGGRTTQQWTVTVRATNTPPIILSTPTPYAPFDADYFYAVNAQDIDEDQLSYSVLPNDLGITISESGLVTWRSPFFHGTSTSAVIRVDDKHGGIVEQTLNLITYNAATNSPPVITQGLPSFWLQGSVSSYAIVTQDETQEPTSLHYSLPNAPAGMTIDPLHGLIRWNPTVEQIGEHTVTVRVTDGEFYDTETKTMMVRRNAAPVLASIAPQQVTGGNVWSLQAAATDADGDPLTYTLSTVPPQPSAMVIDAHTGLITWPTSLVTSTQTYTVSVFASDGYGGYDLKSFTLTVSPDTTKPELHIFAFPATFEVNKPGEVLVTASDNVALQPNSLNLKLVQFTPTPGGPVTLHNQNIVLNQTGRATLSYNQAGYYLLRATVLDTQGTPAQEVLELQVTPDATPPTISITSPTYNQSIFEPLQISGSIFDPQHSFHDWSVKLHKVGTTNEPTLIATGNQEVLNSYLASVDTTLLDNGLWNVLVYATDQAGNTATQVVPIVLEGNYKPGVLSLSFTDLQLPTSDVPLKIQRTYSSNRANTNLDFGNGWSLDFGIPKVEVAYSENASFSSSGFPVLLEGTRVNVTLPDGTKEGFTFQPYPEHPNMLGISISWIPYFVPDKGNTSFLEVPKTPVFRIANNDTWEFISFTGGASYHPASAEFGGSWQLYLQSGLKVNVDGRVANKAWIEDRNGNRTTITPDRIEHWSGRKFIITRDGQKRITQIDVAAGPTNLPIKTVRYTYEDGNLSSYMDASGQITSMTYAPGHLLQSIKDAVGREQLKATYGADKRVQSLKDVENWATGYSYDIAAKKQTIDAGANGAANDAVVVMDRRGNPLRVVDATGVENQSAYDKDGKLQEQRQIIGSKDSSTGIQDDLVTRYQYNEFGQPTAVTNPQGGITQYSYDSTLNLVNSVTSPTGQTTYMSYDTKGNLTQSTDPSGASTVLTYGDRGKVTKVTDQFGQIVVTNFYDSLGNLVKTIDRNDQVVRTEYDILGRTVAKIVEVSGTLQTREETEYDSSDRVIATRWKHVTQDGSGNWVTELNWSTSTVYDLATGLVKRQVNERGLATDYYYDRRGNTTLTINEVAVRTPGVSGTFVDSKTLVGQWTVYDEQGRVAVATATIPINASTPFQSPAVSATETFYDSAGRVIGTKQLTNVIVVVADSSGNSPNTNNYHDLVATVANRNSSANPIVTVSSTQSIFDGAGREVKRRDANGLWTESYYGFSGEVVQERSQTKNSGGDIVWLVTRTAFDEYGRPILATDSVLEGTSSTIGTRTFYDDLGRAYQTERREGVKLTLLDRFGAVVTPGANAEGPFSMRIDNQGVDAQGNANLVSRSVSYYNAKGQLIRSVSNIGTGHTGTETRYEYDALGRQFRQIGAPVQTVDGVDPLRLVTETEYDDEGRAYKSITNIRGRYVGENLVLDRSAAVTTEQVFDAQGRAFKNILPDDSFTQVEFDNWGHVVRESPQLKRGANESDAALDARRVSLSKQMAYDANGRLISVTLPAVLDPTDSDGDGNSGLDNPKFDYAYDWAGNQTWLVDARGNRTKFTFDSEGRQVSRTLPAGEQEFFTYHARGQQLTHTSFEGIVTESVYDNGTTDMATSDPNYRVGSGRLMEQRFYSSVAAFNAGASAASQVWKNTYDAFGRKLSVERLARSTPGGALSQIRLERWIYDNQGRMIQASSPEGTINYAYNQVTGLKTRMWTTKAAGLDSNNLADAVEDTRYSYNELGWLTGVTVVEKNDAPLSTANQEKTSYSYDLLGRQLRIDLPGGVIETTEVNKLGAITRKRHYAPDSTPHDLSDNKLRDEFVYTLDASGQRTRLVETFWFDTDNNPQTPDVPKSTTYDWLYDANNRLTQETIDSFDNAVDRTDTFTMDLFGNRVKRTTDLASTPNLVDQAITYHYDPNDRILEELLDLGNSGSIDQTTTYGWNVTQQASKTVSAAGVTQSMQSFSYDLLGRLATVINTKPGTHSSRVDYAYDSSGIRISATEYADGNDNGVFEIGEKGNTTEYLIDHANFTGYAQTIVETTKNAVGQPIKRVAYTFGTDELTQTTYDYSSSSLQPTVSSLAFGHDAHGSVRVLFEAASVIAQAYTYAAYGELIAIHNRLTQSVGVVGSTGLEGQAITNLLYSGEAFDSRIGQQYLRARWYSSNNGRLASLDSFFGNHRESLSFNKYNYTHSNPISGTDPSGQETLGSLGARIGGFASMLATSGIRAAGYLRYKAYDLAFMAYMNLDKLALFTGRAFFGTLKYVTIPAAAVMALEQALFNEVDPFTQGVFNTSINALTLLFSVHGFASMGVASQPSPTSPWSNYQRTAWFSRRYLSTPARTGEISQGKAMSINDGTTSIGVGELSTNSGRKSYLSFSTGGEANYNRYFVRYRPPSDRQLVVGPAVAGRTREGDAENKILEEAFRGTDASSRGTLRIFVSGNADEVCRGCQATAIEFTRQRSINVEIMLESTGEVFYFSNGAQVTVQPGGSY